MENNMENNMQNDMEEVRTEITAEPEKPAFNWKKEAGEWVVAIIAAVVIAFVIRTYFFTLVQVSGPSMENTLHTGDRLVVTRLNYTPKAGDIVVFRPDQHYNEPYIKRVIATEGQTVDIDFARGIVYVDGEALQEDYIKNPTQRQGDVQFPITVAEGCVFVMGDNRMESHDGRSLDVSSVKTKDFSDDDVYYSYVDEKTGEVKSSPIYYGCVDKDDIIGKAQIRLWPFDKIGSLY